jgi:hypothetical protein
MEIGTASPKITQQNLNIPLSALRSPLSALRSPLSALRSPLYAHILEFPFQYFKCQTTYIVVRK